MDAVNTFETHNTKLMVRGEYLFLLIVCIGVTLYNWNDLRLIPFLILFGYIDIIGYLPGGIAYRRLGGRVPTVFYYLYNGTHNFISAGLVALAWCYFVGPEWALMGIPIHLFGDRSLFGNAFKSRGFSFEPVKHPLFEKFEKAFSRSRLLYDRPMKKDKMILLMEKFGHHASLNLVFNKDTSIFCCPGINGFIPYRDDGSCLFIFSGVVAREEERAALLDKLLDFARKESRCVACVQLRNEQAKLFEGRGFSVNQMGCSYTQDISNFSLRGTAFMSLRNKLKRASRSGVTVKEMARDVPLDEHARGQLSAITSRWLASKKQSKLLSFMVGELDPNDLGNVRIFAAFKNDEIIAYISYVPSYLPGRGYMHDLTRRLAEVPPGTMELINVTAIERFVEEGADYLAYGFTPFCGISADFDSFESRNKLLSYIVKKLEKHGKRLYPAISQVEYKRKWKPTKTDPEYFAVYGGFKMRYLFRLLRITNAI